MKGSIVVGLALVAVFLCAPGEVGFFVLLFFLLLVLGALAGAAKGK